MFAILVCKFYLSKFVCYKNSSNILGFLRRALYLEVVKVVEKFLFR